MRKDIVEAAGEFSAYGALKLAWSFGSGAEHLIPSDFRKVATGCFSFEGLELDSWGLGLSGTYARGEAVSQDVACPPSDWLLPWWNADTSGSGSLEVFLAVEAPSGWSSWYPMGSWGQKPTSFFAEDAVASLRTDTLFLSGTTTRYRIRLVFSTGDQPGSVRLRRFGLICRDKGEKVHPSRSYLLKDCALNVPPRSQMVEAADVKGRICSPTCCAMALESLGIGLPTLLVAADCYDAGAGIYGNWPFNVASLWRLGARARLDYFPNMESAAADILRGHPCICSIRFAEGKLPGAPISKSSGHLVLVRGFSRSEGGKAKVLVNDPAAPSRDSVMRSYAVEDFEAAWTGVAYVVEGSSRPQPQ
ncbi:MAG TPA: C39 family peptidase [Rectinemataceae bacterium]